MKPSLSTIDGNTVASNPGSLRLNPFQWVRHYPFWPAILGLGFVGSLALLWISLWFLLVAVPLGLLKAVYWKRIADHFRYGDGNPGLVLQAHPLRLATATDMGVFGGFFPVLKVVQHGFSLQRVESIQAGDIIPTISLYSRQGSAYPQHWSDFDPVPVFCATSDPAQLAYAASRMTEDGLSFLRDLVDRSSSLEPGLHWFDPVTREPIAGPPA